MAKRRIRKGKTETWVPRHKWKLGKAVSHPGYWRTKRPKGMKRIVGNKPVLLYPVYNEYRERMGWKRKNRGI